MDWTRYALTFPCPDSVETIGWSLEIWGAFVMSVPTLMDLRLRTLPIASWEDTCTTRSNNKSSNNGKRKYLKEMLRTR
jgi:hypothetical protein